MSGAPADDGRDELAPAGSGGASGSGASSSDAADGGGPVDGGACGPISACGGDLTGTWFQTSSCNITWNESGRCTETEVIVPQSPESITFSGGTFAETYVYEQATWRDTVSRDCLAAVDGDWGMACDGYGEMALGPGDAGPPVRCSTSASSCVCSATRGTPTILSTPLTVGTYTISGTSFTIGPYTQGYCVQGNTLYLVWSASGMGNGASYVTLTRQ